MQTQTIQNTKITLNPKIASAEKTHATTQNFQIKYLKDSELHENLKSLAQKERKLNHVILLHIMEVDRRKLYLAKAYPSLWAYLTKGIGYSAPQAQRRIDAARLMIQVPALGEKIEKGTIHFSQVTLVQKILKEMKRTKEATLPAAQKQELIEKLDNKSPQETQKILAQTFQIQPQIQEVKKTQRDESVRIEMTFTKEEMEMLEWAKVMLAHGIHRSETDFQLKSLFLYCTKKVLKEKTGHQM